MTINNVPWASMRRRCPAVCSTVAVVASPVSINSPANAGAAMRWLARLSEIKVTRIKVTNV